jgi:hypothetical protein
MQGAQKLRSEAHLRVRRNDEVAAQRRRWTFYETIKIERSPSRGWQQKGKQLGLSMQRRPQRPGSQMASPNPLLPEVPRGRQ